MKKLICILLALAPLMSIGQSSKISAMTANPSITGLEVFPLAKSGANYKESFNNLKAWISSPLQTKLNGTGFVKATGTTISYDNSTYLTGNQSISFAPNALGDVTGSASGATSIAPVLSIGTGKVTSTAILDGTILNVDINSAAAIAVSKLANGTAGQLLIAVGPITNAPVWTTVSGDVAINSAGITSIASLASSKITGITNGTSASAGTLGERISSSVSSLSAVTCTTLTAINVTSISLTAGDWEITGVVDYSAGIGTSIANMLQGSSTASATLGADDTYSSVVLNGTPGAICRNPIPTRQILFQLPSPTTVYLVAQPTFTLGTLSAYGTINAIRVR